MRPAGSWAVRAGLLGLAAAVVLALALRWHFAEAHRDAARLAESCRSGKILTESPQRIVADIQALSPAALRWLVGALRSDGWGEEPGTRVVIELASERWGELEPEAACRALSERGFAVRPQDALWVAFETWVARDREAATAFAGRKFTRWPSQEAAAECLAQKPGPPGLPSPGQVAAMQISELTALMEGQVRQEGGASHLRSLRLRLAGWRWAELDAADALRFLGLYQSWHHLEHPVADLIVERWLVADPNNAFGEVVDVLGSGEPPRTGLDRLTAAAVLDPPDPLRRLRGSGFTKAATLGRAASAAVMRQPEEVVRCLDKLRQMGPGGAGFSFGLGSALGRRDPAAFVSFAARITDAHCASVYADAGTGPWCRRDPAGARAWVESLGADRPGLAAAGALASAWAENDEGAALAWADDRTAPEVRIAAQKGALVVIAGRDRAIGLAAMAERSDQPAIRQLLAGRAGGWATVDPRAAAEWSRRLGGEVAGPVLAEVLRAWARSDLDAASQWVRETGSNGVPDEASTAIAQVALAGRRPSIAAEFARTLSDAALRRTHLSNALQAWGGADPLAAEAWLERQALDRSERDALLQTIVIGHVGNVWITDPGRTADWAAARRDPAGDAAVQVVLGRWVERDFVAAEKWLGAVAVEPSRRESWAAGFAKAAIPKHPDLACVWALLLEDSSTRTAILREAVRGWFRKDALAAANWVETAPLGPTLQQKLRAEISRP